MDVLNRALVGILLPDTVRETLTQAQFLLKRKVMGAEMRWIPGGELAIILAPLGECTVQQLSVIERELREIGPKLAPLSIQWNGWLPLPNATTPKEAAFGFGAGHESLAGLSTTLIHRLSGPDSAESYVPGVRLGRLRQMNDSGRVALGRAMKMTPSPEVPGFEVNKLHLLVSQSGAQGPYLHPLAEVELAGE